jgi:addiction module HigA family antidote
MESLRDKNRRPTHPGEILLEDVLPEIGITITEFAKRLKVSRRTVSEILHGHRSLTPDMAIRISRLIGGTPDGWLKIQQAVDLWDLEHSNSKLYASIKRMAGQQEARAS